MYFRLERYPDNAHAEPILEPRPELDWEAKAVFNPSVVRDGEIFHMLYRTYPRMLENWTLRIDRPGYTFKNQVSSIGYAKSMDGIHFERLDRPVIAPSEPYDRYGCEDPRVTKLGDTFYITYTAIDAPIDERPIPIEQKTVPNVRIALASTKDFVTFEKHGIVGPPVKSKAAALFPELIDGKVALALTINSDSQNSRVALRYFDSIDELLHPDTDRWLAFMNEPANVVLKTQWWLQRGPELGAVPVKTDRGWLLIYSAEAMANTWTISAALLDLADPSKLLARMPGYILQPATPYEVDGLVPCVTFPEGAVVVGDELYVYYGCADTCIGLARCKLNDLLAELEKEIGREL